MVIHVHFQFYLSLFRPPRNTGNARSRCKYQIQDFRQHIFPPQSTFLTGAQALIMLPLPPPPPLWWVGVSFSLLVPSSVFFLKSLGARMFPTRRLRRLLSIPRFYTLTAGNLPLPRRNYPLNRPPLLFFFYAYM